MASFVWALQERWNINQFIEIRYTVFLLVYNSKTEVVASQYLPMNYYNHMQFT